MPLVQPGPWVKPQYFDNNGDPLVGGLLYSYIGGTTTPQATYTDSTGTVVNTNPVVLDAAGRAEIWLIAASYRLELRTSAGVMLWTVDNVPGLGSLISVGNLSPLFTSVLAGGALTFTLSDAAPGTLFGRFAGTTGPPSYGAVGSNREITHNESGQMVGDGDFMWDAATFVLAVGRTGNAFVAPSIRLSAEAGGGQVTFGTGTTPHIREVTDWEYTSDANSDFSLGFSGNTGMLKLYTPGGAAGLPLGTASLGRGASFGRLMLNNGVSAAGIFAGADVVGGSVADPNTVVSAPTGSLFITTNGGAGTTLWVKESSPTASTGWVAK